jgi:hypothetical protein
MIFRNGGSGGDHAGLCWGVASMTGLTGECGPDEDGGGISLARDGCCTGSDLAGRVSTIGTTPSLRVVSVITTQLPTGARTHRMTNTARMG